MSERLIGIVQGVILAKGVFGFNEKQKQFRFILELGKGNNYLFLHHVRKTIGGGKVVGYKSRSPYQYYYIGGLKDCYKIIVPFMDRFMMGYYRSEEYKQWRYKLVEYIQKSSRIGIRNLLSVEDQCYRPEPEQTA